MLRFIKQKLPTARNLMLILLLLSSVNALSVGRDEELAQSSKCIHWFNFFEMKNQIPKDLLYSIALHETGRTHSRLGIKIPWPWTINVEGKGYFFDSKQEAIKFVKQQMAFGKRSIDVGCMQINLKYHPTAFKNLQEAFDPRFNIEYGANFIKEKYIAAGNWQKAIANYHSANLELGSKYHKSVVKIASNIEKHKFNTKAYNMWAPAKPLYTAASFKPLLPELKQRRYRSNMMVYIPKNALRRVN